MIDDQRFFRKQKPEGGGTNYRRKARKALREAGKLEGLNPKQRKRRITRKANRMMEKDTVMMGDVTNKVPFSKGGMAKKKGYAKGGMVGASNPPAQKRTPKK